MSRREVRLRVAFVLNANVLSSSLRSSSNLTSFLVTLVLMFFALLAYFRVFSVSSKFDTAEEMLAIITVLQFPPKLSLRRRVSLESR